jgi:hypothetical protein
MTRFLFVGGALVMDLATAAWGQPSLAIVRGPPGSGEVVIGWGTKPGLEYALWAVHDLSVESSEASARAGQWAAESDSLSLATQAAGAAGFYWVEEREVSRSAYDPSWAGVMPTRVRSIRHEDQSSAEVNGAALKGALQALQPGDRLEIGGGTYSIDSFTALDLQGTAEAPIWITAAAGEKVVITRPNAAQNIINVGVNSPTRYVCFRGLEFAGGSHGIRLYDCAQLWIDRCRVRDTGDVGISANARNTSRLHITRNEVWNTGGTGEGMYLGANQGAVTMSESVIALNHVHDTQNGVSQGDGIEVKQGSWGNWIVENHVHDCNYPCLLVYGTAGRPANIVERNLCYRSNDNTMQIQGECLVRNNLVIAGAGSAFASQPHQGDPTRLTVVHNTFVNTGTTARLSGWDQGTDMVFANNACVSRSGAALVANNSTAGVAFAGNVCSGSVSAGLPGTVSGNGLADFVDVAWDGTRRDAHPAAVSALVGAAVDLYAVEADLEGASRSSPHAAGCYAAARAVNSAWGGGSNW